MTLFARLFWWRLRFFSTTSYRLLERRWQAVLLVLLILSPQAMPIPDQLRLLGWPVLTIALGRHVGLSALCWVVVLAFAWMWTGLQARALLGGNGWQLLRSLPKVSRQARWVDLAVFACADLPVLLPFGAALASLGLARGGPQLSAIAAVLALAAQLPILQCLVLQNQRVGMLCVVFDLLGMAAAGAGGSAWWLALMVVAGSVLGICLMARTAGVSLKRASRLPRFLRVHRAAKVEWNLALINLRFLFGAKQTTQHVRLLLCSLISVALFAVLRQTRIEAASMPVVLVVLALPPLVLSLAALSIELRALHAPAMPMNRALGLNAAQLRRSSLLVLNSVFCVLCLPLAFSLGIRGPSWQGWQGWQVLALFPVGMAALTACILLNDRHFNQALIPKAAVVAGACVALLKFLL